MGGIKMDLKPFRWLFVALSLLLLTGCFWQEGVIKVGSTPGDAQVYVNGVWQGNTGSRSGEYLTVSLRKGNYTIELRKAIDDANEFYSFREVMVQANAEQVITVTLHERLTDFGAQRQREAEEMMREQTRGEGASPRLLDSVAGKEESALGLEEEAKPTHEQLSRAAADPERDEGLDVTDLGQLDKNKILAALISEVVTIGGGSFEMGSMRDEPDEKPVRMVQVKSFRMMATPVTFDMWDACFIDRGCPYIPSDRDWGRGNRPVIYVSYHDIVDQFIPWLNQQTGRQFRLPTEAEWEFAARAGTSTRYFWGEELIANRANCQACGSQWDGKQTAPVKSFPPNAWGLYEMLGNVYEWTADCWVAHYHRAPIDGSARRDGDCNQAPIRGGAWSAQPRWVRSANRDADTRDYRFSGLGFRLVLEN
jgi:formylglycine-generating enzyme required for sulfatase activity